MRACWCTLSGTDACKHCSNNSSYIDWNNNWKEDMEKYYSDKRSVKKRFWSTSSYEETKG